MLVALAVLVGLVVLALAAPVGLTLRVEKTEQLRSSWRVRWLFGLVNVVSKANRSSRQSTPSLRKQPRPSRAKGSGQRGLAALRTPGFARRVVRLVTDLARTVHCEELSLHGVFGFEDPADTGLLYGALVPMLAVTGGRGLDVSCRPDFTESRVEGACTVTLTVRPLDVVGACVAFGCSPPVLRAARAWSVAGRA